MRKKTIILTGASGFIGANLLRRLLGLGRNLHVLIRPTSYPWRIKNLIKHVSCHEIDLADKKKLQTTVTRIKPQIIYHLSAYGGYPFQGELEKMIATNIVGTMNLLTALQQIDYELFINTGSSSEYGVKNKPMKETDSLAPASFYAATKAGTTHLCQVFAQMHHKPIVTVRPFSIYGPYEEPTRLIPTTIVSCLKNSDLHLTNGQEQRDFLYIDDFIDGLLLLEKHQKQLTGKIINFGSGTQHATREIVEIIYKLTKSKTRLLWGTYPNRLWDTNFWLADITLAKKILSWRPKYTLEKGLSATIMWFKKNLYPSYSGPD